MKKIVKWFFSFLHIKISEEKQETFAQFIGFGLVGVTNTLISFVVFAVLLALFPYFNKGNNYIIANVISFFVSVTNAFIWNNLLVFKKKNNESRSLLFSYIKTVISYAGTGLLLSNVFLFIAVDYFSFNKYISNLVIIFVTIPINFLMNKFWAFKSSKNNIKEG